MEFKRFQEINPKPFKLIGLNIEPYKSVDAKIVEEEVIINDESVFSEASDSPFAPLHVHSQFSVLQATIDVKSLVNKAVEMKMPAVGLTDHTNMCGAYKFIEAVINHPVNANVNDGEAPSLKAVLGCELIGGWGNICTNFSFLPLF